MPNNLRNRAAKFQTISRIWALLDGKEKWFIGLMALVRLGLVSLDLAGIFLVGVVVSLLSGTTIASSSQLAVLLDFLRQLGIHNGYAVLLFGSAAFFIIKGLVSVFLNNITSKQVAKIEWRKSVKIFAIIQSQPIDFLEKYSSQQLLFAVTGSVSSATTQAIVLASTAISEVALLLAISTYLAMTNLVLFILIALFFGAVGLIINALVTGASGRAAQGLHDSTLKSQGIVLDLANGFRQSFVSPNRQSLTHKFSENRLEGARQSATYQAITSLPRYITEISIMLGAGILVSQRIFIEQGGASATDIAIFLAGIFRIVSSMLPLQAALSAWKIVETESRLALEISEAAEDASIQMTQNEITVPTGAIGLKMANIAFRYSGASELALKNVSFELTPGTFAAVVGPSGSGKSTLADVLLGIRLPESGIVLINGINARDYILCNKGDVAYVPQSTRIFSASLRQNISLNFGEPFPEEEVRVKSLLADLGLGAVASIDELGLEVQLGDGGVGLSGGQEQRIGLARALFTRPKLLVLDEATSALDDGTQTLVQEVLNRLHGEVTMVVIAHRKETIQSADIIFRLDNGHLTKVHALRNEGDLAP